MTPLNLLYKNFKYSEKLKNYDLFFTMNSNNLELVNNLLKKKYLKQYQIGGELIPDSDLENASITHFSFHGIIKTNANLLVPNGIYLIIPLCCGFSNYISGSDYLFFSKPDTEIKK